MKLLDNLIAVFSPMMRSTLELERLNRIWERALEEKEIDVLDEVLSHRWKYHKEKVRLLLKLYNHETKQN